MHSQYILSKEHMSRTILDECNEQIKPRGIEYFRKNEDEASVIFQKILHTRAMRLLVENILSELPEQLRLDLESRLRGMNAEQVQTVLTNAITYQCLYKSESN